ncbi:Gag polyprotein [Cricetulus griseus]|uniref:Gag polyprotein n=1 Tax=Cricetulus griseus TaxID=10029 RepID=A0A061IDV6_CRIGR|nr:Gag polyprotein [Cricetulus griseus]
MGQQLTTPLSLTLDHSGDVWDRANNQSLDVKKKKLQTFCSSEWPTFNVGWPRDGSFNLEIILQVKEKCLILDPKDTPTRQKIPDPDSDPRSLKKIMGLHGL